PRQTESMSFKPPAQLLKRRRATLPTAQTRWPPGADFCLAVGVSSHQIDGVTGSKPYKTQRRGLAATAQITLIGGPTALIEVDGYRLLTDPTFDPPSHYEVAGRIYSAHQDGAAAGRRRRSNQTHRRGIA